MAPPKPSSLRVALAFTLALRVLYSLLGVLIAPRLTLDPTRIASNHFTSDLIQPSDGWRFALLGVWERFDTLWYLHIAQHGYDRPDGVVFFPLYPVLIRGVSAVVGHPLVAALLVSTAAAFFLFWGLHKLLLLDLEPEPALRALALYALWPAAFILFAGFVESLVIALIVWSIYFARTDRGWAAGLAGMFAGLAKAVGFLVAVPLAFLAWRRRSWRGLAGALCLAGPAAFMAWLALTGRPQPGEVYLKYWRTGVAPPWITLSDTVRQAFSSHPVLQIHLVIIALVALLALSRAVRPEYIAYSAGALLFVLTKHSDPSQQPWARYLLIVFPAQIHLALLTRPLPAFALASVPLFALNVWFMWNFMDWALVI